VGIIISFEKKQYVRILLTLISICLFLTTQAQSTQAEYLEAKRQYTLGNYAASKLAFGALSTDKMFGVYSSFYYALSAYKNGETKLAYDMWKQISINNGSWAQIDEVNYWLANLSFEMKNFDAGFSYFQSLSGDLQKLTIHVSLDNLPVSELLATFDAY